MRFMAAWYTIRSRLDRARAAARLPGAYARPRCLRHRPQITSSAIGAHGSAGRCWRLRAKPARTGASRPARSRSLAGSRGASRARRSSLEFDPFKPERGVGRRRRQPVLLGVRPSAGGDPGAPRAGHGALVREVFSRSADLAARPRRAARIWPYRRAFHCFLLSQINTLPRTGVLGTPRKLRGARFRSHRHWRSGPGQLPTEPALTHLHRTARPRATVTTVHDILPRRGTCGAILLAGSRRPPPAHHGSPASSRPSS